MTRSNLNYYSGAYLDKSRSLSRISGFTLIELLIVIAIIAILAGAVFVALDPLTRFRDARDSTRWTDVTALVTAIKLDQVDNRGSYLTAITNMNADAAYMISDDVTSTGCNITCDAESGIPASYCVDLSGLVDQGYLAALPVSPTGVVTYSSTYTGYYMIKNSNGSISVGACEAENTDAILVNQ